MCRSIAFEPALYVAARRGQPTFPYFLVDQHAVLSANEDSAAFRTDIYRSVDAVAAVQARQLVPLRSGELVVMCAEVAPSAFDLNELVQASIRNQVVVRGGRRHIRSARTPNGHGHFIPRVDQRSEEVPIHVAATQAPSPGSGQLPALPGSPEAAARGSLNLLPQADHAPTQSSPRRGR